MIFVDLNKKYLYEIEEIYFGFCILIIRNFWLIKVHLAKYWIFSRYQIFQMKFLSICILHNFCYFKQWFRWIHTLNNNKIDMYTIKHIYRWNLLWLTVEILLTRIIEEKNWLVILCYPDYTAFYLTDSRYLCFTPNTLQKLFVCLWENSGEVWNHCLPVTQAQRKGAAQKRIQKI